MPLVRLLLDLTEEVRAPCEASAKHPTDGTFDLWVMCGGEGVHEWCVEFADE